VISAEDGKEQPLRTGNYFGNGGTHFHPIMKIRVPLRVTKFSVAVLLAGILLLMWNCFSVWQHVQELQNVSTKVMYSRIHR
jgi:hypothetical protein